MALTVNTNISSIIAQRSFDVLDTMTPEEIEEFGKRKGILKVSRRDLPVVMSKKLWGATTVATTMIFAAKAGVEVFVTGGIGGVHRGAQQTFDISADLQELAHTNVTVVCAGAKAILDLPKTIFFLPFVKCSKLFLLYLKFLFL